MSRTPGLAPLATSSALSRALLWGEARPPVDAPVFAAALVLSVPTDRGAHDTARACAIILAFLLVRLGLMVGLGLGVDEDYTLANARGFALSYFDHPPLHQWIAGLSLVMFGHTTWARLPFVVIFAGTSWVLFTLTRHLFGSRAALWTLIALNLSAFFTVSAGGWVVPDGPLLFCLALAADNMARLFFPRTSVPDPWTRWLSIGLWLGLAGLSKYSAVLTAAGLLVFLGTSRAHRQWLKHPAPYVGAAVALITLAPVFVWNARNGWLSLAFQTGRARPHQSISLSHLAAMVGGEFGLLLPWVFVPLVIALVVAIRSARPGGRTAFLLCLGCPAIIVFTIVPLWGDRGFPHWTMPGWFFAFPLLGVWLAKGGGPWLRPQAWSLFSATALAIAIGIVVSHASSGWIRRAWPTMFAAGDPVLESLSWSHLQTMGPFTGPPPDFIVASRWIDGAKLAAAFNETIPVLVFSDDPRQFAFSHDVGAFLHKNAVIVVGATQADHDLPPLASYFATLGAPEALWLGRGSLAEIPLVAVRATDLTRPYPLPYPLRMPAGYAAAERTTP